MPKRVIIVDDSEFVLSMSSFILSAAGYDTHTATGGFEALEIMAQMPIDLAVIDINMPGMDGYTLVRKIRSDDALGEIPVIIVTTEKEAQDKEKGFEAGADVYLVKPVHPNELVAQVRLLIGE